VPEVQEDSILATGKKADRAAPSDATAGAKSKLSENWIANAAWIDDRKPNP